MTAELEAGIVARDAEMLRAFYTRVMGFALVEHFEHAAGAVDKLRRDAARLKIFRAEGSVEAVVGASDRCVLIAPTNHRAAARMALVCDPEGNVWGLLAEEHEEQDRRS